MPKLLKTILICLMTACLALGGGIVASGGAYDSYKWSFGEARWQIKYNNFVDAVSSLGSLITNWVGTVDSLTLIETAPVYSDASTFILAGNFEALLTPGKRLVADCGVDNLRPNTVVSCTYAAGDSTVVVNAANLTANLAAVSYYATRNGVNTYGSGDIVAAEFGAPSWDNLQAIVVLANASGRRILLTPGNWPVDGDLSITAPVYPVPGAVFAVATGQTLTINGTLDAGLYQIFSCTGTGAVAGLKESNPVWFGAIGDNSTDCTIPVNQSIAAISAVGAKWTLPTGQYRITDDLTVTSKTKFVMEMIGELVPYTTSSPGQWEVLDTTAPDGVLNLDTCTDFTIIPRFIQTDVANFGNGNVIYLTNCQRWKIVDGIINVRCNGDVTGGKGAIRVGAECQDWQISNNYLKAWYGVFAGSSILIPSPYWLNTKRFIISGNIIEGNQTHSVDGGIGISIDSPNATITHGLISNNIIQNFGNYVGASLGIACASADTINVENNSVTNVRTGIHIETLSKFISIIGNSITTPLVAGIATVHTAGNQVSDLQISNNIIQIDSALAVSGISISGVTGAGNSTERIKVNNNKIINTNAVQCIGYGLLANYVNNSEFFNNDVRGLWAVGFQVLQGDVGRCRIDKNIISGTFTTYAMRINQSAMALVSCEGNRVYNASVVGASDISFHTDYPSLGHPYLNQAAGSSMGAGETTMQSTTLLGRTVPNGALIEVEVFGQTAANANNKTVIVYLGNEAPYGYQVLYTTGAVAANNKKFHFSIKIEARPFGAQAVRISGTYNDVPFVVNQLAITKDLTVDNIIKVTGTGTADYDITCSSLNCKIVN